MVETRFIASSRDGADCMIVWGYADGPMVFGYHSGFFGK